MTSPLTLEVAEQQLRDALDSGDEVAILDACADVDRLDIHRPPVPMLAAALYYAQEGLRVFPLRPGTKVPFAGSNGCLGATGNEELIRDWWDDTPNANIGIATGHLVDVVDIDGLPGQIARARNAPLFDALTILGTVSTPRPGGGHLYVPAAGVGNKASLLDHVDYRGNGGYVVAPPSVITEGPNPGRYEWVRPLDVSDVKSVAA